ncbi:2OG-Fe(II)-dependent halogenase WelO5 family protein [Actinoplanes sp. CA-252034]|uniref:2OG-Fe(II)-dependent halogenase WelO5 family protein n=1 Tax=Actinoplanes sp. CA-252034 TaxID=3239906 RepID=UPI003D95294F
MSLLTSSLLDPFFVSVDAASLTSWRIGSLLSGRTAVLRIPHMIDSESCDKLVERLDDLTLDLYDEQRVYPPIARFGPAINDFRRDGRLDDGYWEHASRAARAWSEVDFEGDPVALSIQAFRQAWPGSVEVATVQGRPLFAGMIREINGGAHAHFDDVVREFPAGIFDTEVVAQLAFNLYLSMPETGGETSVWRRRWQPADERYRHRYGYDRELMANCQSIVAKPGAGDVLVFDPRNYHAVEPGDGRRRIAVAFFIALSARGDLLIWS